MTLRHRVWPWIYLHGAKRLTGVVDMVSTPGLGSRNFFSRRHTASQPLEKYGIVEGRLSGGEKVHENRLGLAELIDPIDERELEALAVSAIKEHRLRLAKAEDAYEAWIAVQFDESDHGRQLKADYIQAMLDSHAHMSVVEV